MNLLKAILDYKKNSQKIFPYSGISLQTELTNIPKRYKNSDKGTLINLFENSWGILNNGEYNEFGYSIQSITKNYINKEGSYLVGEIEKNKILYQATVEASSEPIFRLKLKNHDTEVVFKFLRYHDNRHWSVKMDNPWCFLDIIKKHNSYEEKLSLGAHGYTYNGPCLRGLYIKIDSRFYIDHKKNIFMIGNQPGSKILNSAQPFNKKLNELLTPFDIQYKEN